MKKIFKYTLNFAGDIEIEMPIDSKVLFVMTDRLRSPVLYAEVRDNIPAEKRTFRSVPTGGEVPEKGTYIGSYSLSEGQWIGHVYEIPNFKSNISK